MRKGYEAKLVFSNSGNLVAISTGSDACAEHECGSHALQSHLSTAYDEQESLVKKLRAGEPVSYPKLKDLKRISKFPKGLQFIEVPGTDSQEPEAFMGYAAHELTEYANRELSFSFSSRGDKNVAGAWDSQTFAIRVRGKRYVKALKGFYQALLEGKCMFGGTFFRKEDYLSGVVLVNATYVDDASWKALEQAQHEYESGLRLKARDDTRELYQEMIALSGSKGYYFGHVWVKWADAAEDSVDYCLNPGYNVKADYLGPYTRQQLLDWAKAGYSYQLKSYKEAA